MPKGTPSHALPVPRRNGHPQIADGIPEKPSNSEVLRGQDQEDTAYICVGVLGNAGVPPAAGGPVRFISPTPLSGGQQSGCAGQTPSLPWGWSRCAGAGLDLECSSQLEAVKMNNGSASWKTACGVRDF